MKKIGLVFSGGGGKGPYQVGVWRAIKELGLTLNISAVSGTSVGALNAVLFAQQDIDNAEQAWLSMSPSDILHIDVERVINFIVSKGISAPLALTQLMMEGVFSRNGLSRIISTYFDENLFINEGIPCFACATKLPLIKPSYFDLRTSNKNEIEQVLLASSAIPLIFEAQRIGTTNYYDGFLSDNTPIAPLIDEGCEVVIAVMLSRSELVPKKLYENCRIITIYPQEDLGGALDFNNIADKLQKGYDDGMKVLAPAFELAKVNFQYSKELKRYKYQHEKFKLNMKNRQLVKDLSEQAKLDLLKEIDKW